MRLGLTVIAAVLCGLPAPATAAEGGQLRAAMQSARWTGPLLASNAETLPRGHFYTEPYFFDVISGGDHHPGSSGFYQYGLRDNFTIGVQPAFATRANRPGRGMTIGDFKLLSQLRVTHFTPDHRVPSVAIVLNQVLPTGKFDRLGPSQQGHGSGAFSTEVGVNVQNYFLLPNGRLLRARINVLQSVPCRTRVSGRSVYGTADGFRGRARPGAKTTLILGAEYSLTREWVLALDLIREASRAAKVTGRDADGTLVDRRAPSSRDIGFAPAIEYNWSDRAGAIVGVWVSPKGHNSAASVTPAIAIQRFW